MVLNANTIVDPWTVMIESLNAFIAYVTMPAPLCSDDLTLRTQMVGIKPLY